MANLNRVLLIGRLTRTPELRYTPGGTPVTDLGLALNRSYTSQSGERREETCFIDVVVWGRQAENCHKYLSKGRQVFVEGRLKMDVWEKDGQRRSKIQVVADNVQFLDSPVVREGEGGENFSSSSYVAKESELPEGEEQVPF